MRIKELINELQKLQRTFGDDVEVEVCVFESREDFAFDSITRVEEAVNEKGESIVGICLKNAFQDWCEQ